MKKLFSETWFRDRHRRLFARRQRRSAAWGRRLATTGSSRRPVKILAPEVLSFSRNNDETRRFFVNIRAQISDVTARRGLLHIDLAPIRYLGIAAALLMLSEFDRWQRIRGRGPLIANTIRNWDPYITKQLFDMGFFDLLGTYVPPKYRSGSINAQKFIRFSSGDVVDQGKTIIFRRKISENVEDSEAFNLKLYRSLTESIGNVVEHAYPGGFEFHQGVGRRWWLTGYVDDQEGRVKVVVLDHGISIPGSLPRSQTGEKILAFAASLLGERRDDGTLIAAAMAYGRSSLSNPERGKGLSDVLALARDGVGGRLRIISRRGEYEFADGREDSRTTDIPMSGTLIEWDLSIGNQGAPTAGLEKDP